MILQNTEKIIIAGPCALESRDQLKKCIQQLKSLDIYIIRASLWKPRTSPSWDGLGIEGLQILLEETIPCNLIPATEILNEQHAKYIIEALKQYHNDTQMLVWIGARNQNHLEQQKIARILKQNENITLMLKNQMWDDEEHWIGIYKHIISTGFPKNRLLMCHRGFSPGKIYNPKQYRNIPDLQMALRVKEKTQIPMIIDPSHIGGSTENIIEITEKAEDYNFNGYMIESHFDPVNAKTDNQQQLSKQQLEKLLQSLNTSVINV